MGQSRQVAGGSKGLLRTFHSFLLEIWSFTKSKPTAKSLLAHLSQPKAIERMVAASGGHDLRAFDNLTTLKTWADQGPPKGTLYHYPNPYDHQILSIAAQPTPLKIAVQIHSWGLMTQMTVRHMQGEPLEKTLAWAEGEVEGYLRM